MNIEVDAEVVGFARRLAAAGVDVPPTRVHAMLEALDVLGAGSLRSVYWSGRVTLCASPEDVERYDRVFAAHFGRRPDRPPRRVTVPPVTRLIALPDGSGDGARDGHDADPERQRIATASRLEVLRNRDVTTLGPADRAEVGRYISALLPAAPDRVTRRLRPSPSGPVDARRTVRSMLRHGGEPVDLRRQRHGRRQRRLVFLVDVSGSMAPYAETLLRFAHAACRVRPATEVFTVGTRLTRVTRELRRRDPVAALTAASAAIDDWSGGTRLGDELKEFLDRWGQRGTARGAVVVIGSDGWERGDPALLADQMARLARLARRIVWVNPHRGYKGYSPSTGGMRAALPYVDRLVAGHSLGAMQELAALLGGREPLGRARPAREGW
ncbi:vWA domain-containing protein [Jiangella endophytica]|uniref:vWA domain-containing protein n=1 Tax=Jiangella endophytica TaxID=1623398 RepID=UPI000E345A8E|nr:VWA domain-containing protein [Jiangella endophytica]